MTPLGVSARPCWEIRRAVKNVGHRHILVPRKHAVVQDRTTYLTWTSIGVPIPVLPLLNLNLLSRRWCRIEAVPLYLLTSLAALDRDTVYLNSDSNLLNSTNKILRTVSIAEGLIPRSPRFNIPDRFYYIINRVAWVVSGCIS